MGQDEGSSSVTSSPLQSFCMMSLSPSSPWLHPSIKSDERGLYLIQLLLNCAAHVSSHSFDAANAFLDHISLLSSPDGDVMQRIASFFSDALARRLLLRSFPGLYRALTSLSSSPQPTADRTLARAHFLDLCPFLRLAFLLSNQAILDAMDNEKIIHLIDLNASDPTQSLALMHSLKSRPEGPPHLRITGVHHRKEILAHVAGVLSEAAEKLDIPFQFNLIVAPTLDAIDIDNLRVRSGEALAITSALSLHSLLATTTAEDRDPSPRQLHRNSPAAATLAHIHRMVQLGQGTLGELLEKEQTINGGVYVLPCSPSSSLTPPSSPRMEAFLASMWGLSPKIMVITEQESNHNSASLNERFMEALYYYAALFDCLEQTTGRQSTERARVEKMLLGEEIKNIIACEGLERTERHEKLGRWVQRLEMSGFLRVPLSYYGLLEARRMLQGYGCADAYKLREDNSCFFLCWNERPMYSVSAWRCRRYE